MGSIPAAHSEGVCVSECVCEWVSECVCVCMNVCVCECVSECK